MPIKTIFFDLDDTLYPPSTGIWALIRQRMDLYMEHKLGIDPAVIPELRKHLFETYGTTMRGLQLTYHIDEIDFLAYVHDVQVEQRLQPNPELRALLIGLPYRKHIFTNSDENHTRRVLNTLGIMDCFDRVIDIQLVSPSCKPHPDAYRMALQQVGETDPGCCMLIDDSIRNLATARDLGFYTIQIGAEPAVPPFSAHINTILDLSHALSLL